MGGHATKLGTGDAGRVSRVREIGNREPPPRNKVLFGDAIETLRSLPDDYVHCVVTSPPYWPGLRDFGTRRWFGGRTDCAHDIAIEHEAHEKGLVGVKRDARYSRSDTGARVVTHSCSKCGAWHGEMGQEPEPDAFVEHLVELFREVRRVLRADGTCWINMGDGRTRKRYGSEIAPKELALIPQRLAVALQRDGWLVRSEIIWDKPSVKPTAGRDRPQDAHEYILLLTKSDQYWYDGSAIAEPRAGGKGKRNAWSVWTIPWGIRAVSSQHGAAFPARLPERCIAAGCPSSVCMCCGAPYGLDRLESGNDIESPRCRCEEPTRGHALVLDPFAGSGTTLAVAKALKHDYLGIELNPAHKDLIESRIANVVPGNLFGVMLPEDWRAALDVVCKQIGASADVIDRAERVYDARICYLQLYPEAKHGGAPGKAGGGKAKGATVASFATVLAKKTKRSERAIQLDVQIVEGIPSQLRARIQRMALRSSTRLLVAIARLHDDESAQTELVDAYEKRGEAGFAEAMRGIAGPRSQRLARPPLLQRTRAVRIAAGEVHDIEYGSRSIRVHVTSVDGEAARVSVEVVDCE